jgi:hypothetical protein
VEHVAASRQPSGALTRVELLIEKEKKRARASPLALVSIGWEIAREASVRADIEADGTGGVQPRGGGFLGERRRREALDDGPPRGHHRGARLEKVVAIS